MSDEKTPLTTEMKDPEWPKVGDRLFVSDNGRHVAYVRPKESFSVYAIGYKQAADALVERVLEQDYGADLQFYPIAFLYRHYLELRLKQLLICGGNVVYNESKLSHGHDLMRLWSEVRKILEDVWPSSYVDETNTVEACMKEVCSVDAESMSFRYPVTKKGLPTLEVLDRVDLINLKTVMERIGSFLDASSDALREILDNMPREEYY